VQRNHWNIEDWRNESYIYQTLKSCFESDNPTAECGDVPL
jgi:hypothetical protein